MKRLCQTGINEQQLALDRDGFSEAAMGLCLIGSRERYSL